MSEKNLVICDREIRYANCLGENISKREELLVKVYVCSSIEMVQKLSEEREIHLFVVDEDFWYEDRCKVKASQTFVLGRAKAKDLGEEEYLIRKYQCSDQIIQEIFETYIERTNENLMRSTRKNQARIVAVYSPIHRVGKTTFAIAYGRECAKKKKTLYLNLEEYAGFPKELQAGKNLGDLLYYIRQGNTNLGVWLQAVVKKTEELDYISPIPMSLDLKETTMKEWEALIEQVIENSNYELIVLDVSECVQGVVDVLNLCDRIYMPVLGDEISQRKLHQFDENVEQLKAYKIASISQRFYMPENVEEYARARAKEEIGC